MKKNFIDFNNKAKKKKKKKKMTVPFNTDSFWLDTSTI
jgi:hypothetical protein